MMMKGNNEKRSRGRGGGDYAIACGLVTLAFSIFRVGVPLERSNSYSTSTQPSGAAGDATVVATLDSSSPAQVKAPAAAPAPASSSSNLVSMQFTSIETLQVLSNRILGPEKYSKGCPAACGCAGTPVDCPQHFEIKDIEESAGVLLDTKASIYAATKLEQQHIQAAQGCAAGQRHSARGGWCLGQRYSVLEPLKLPDGREIRIPQGHVDVSRRIAMTLEELFRTENVTSVSDFGAGVGQYGVYLKTHMPNLIYRGYDGAGDIEAFTSGFVKYSDFTLPLDQPVSEWVVSLEVGEHIPSKFEGMFIRNLHRHNCKGVILSWAKLGQGGENHINCHSNDYVAHLFTELGYTRDTELEAKLRMSDGNHGWFMGSSMAFRRNDPVC